MKLCVWRTRQRLRHGYIWWSSVDAHTLSFSCVLFLSHTLIFCTCMHRVLQRNWFFFEIKIQKPELFQYVCIKFLVSFFWCTWVEVGGICSTPWLCPSTRGPRTTINPAQIFDNRVFVWDPFPQRALSRSRGVFAVTSFICNVEHWSLRWTPKKKCWKLP